VLLMNSSNKKTDDNLAPEADTSKLLSALKELANLRDDPASFERFARLYPRFVHVPDSDLPYRFAEPLTRIPDLPNRFLLMWQRREDLRKVWRGNSDKLTALLLPGTYPEELSAEEKTQYVSKNESDTAGEWAWPPQIKVDWQRSQFIYVPRTDFQRAVYALFRQSALAKVCANPDCVTPYFIAGRTAQRYCSDSCAKVFQREWKRRWWKEQGSKWRQKKSRRKRGKG
jgi:hypothetical protein